jgi:hypothetical protein
VDHDFFFQNHAFLQEIFGCMICATTKFLLLWCSEEKSKTTVACGAQMTDQCGGTMHHLHNDMQIGSKKGVLIGPLPYVTNPKKNSRGTAPRIYNRN